MNNVQKSIQSIDQKFMIIGRYKISFIKDLEHYLNKYYPQMDSKVFHFDKIYQQREAYLKILEENPKFIFFEIIDSDEIISNYKLIEWIRNNPETEDITLVGLSDDIASEQNEKYLKKGLDAVYLKGESPKDIMNSVFSIRNINKSFRDLYALADLEKKAITRRMILQLDNPIRSLNNKEVKIETNLRLEEGSKEKIYKNKFFTKELGVSAEMTITDFDKEKRFFNKENVASLKLIYCTEARLEQEFNALLESLGKSALEKMTQDKIINQKISFKKSLDRKAQLKIKSWIEKNRYGSQNKKISVLIVDSNISFFQENQSFIEFSKDNDVNFTIVSSFKDVEKSIEKSMPDLIFYQFDEADGYLADTNNKMNHGKKLNKLANALKEYNLNLSIIVAFGSKYKSGYLKEKSLFNRIISTKDNICLNTIAKFIKMLKSKVSLQYEDSINTHYFDKYSNEYLTLARSAKIIHYSEAEVVIESKTQLPKFTPFKITNPWNCWLTIIDDTRTELSNNVSMFRYRATLHNLDEEERKNIRKSVNNVYFSEINKNHDLESLDFYISKIEFLNKKIEEKYIKFSELEKITKSQYDVILLENAYKEDQKKETEKKFVAMFPQEKERVISLNKKHIDEIDKYIDKIEEKIKKTNKVA